MLNVFLDTNIICKDPFFKSNFNELMLNLAKSKKIGLFLSETVFGEIKQKYKEQIDNDIKVLKTLNENSRRFAYNIDIPKIDCNALIDKFDEFYNDLFNQKILNIIYCDYNTIMPNIIEKAIYKLPPFFDNKKMELKDALIWYTYSGYVKNNPHSDVVLLTENKYDFCDITKDDYMLHPELLKENDIFKVFKSADELVKKYNLSSYLEVDPPDWVKELEINEEFVKELLEEQADQLLESYIIDFIENNFDYSLEIFGHYGYEGYLIPHTFYIEEVWGIDYWYQNGYLNISGKMYVSSDVEGMQGKYIDETGYIHYMSNGDIEILLESTFSFKLKQNFTMSNFDTFLSKVNTKK